MALVKRYAQASKKRRQQAERRNRARVNLEGLITKRQQKTVRDKVAKEKLKARREERAHERRESWRPSQRSGSTKIIERSAFLTYQCSNKKRMTRIGIEGQETIFEYF